MRLYKILNEEEYNVYLSTKNFEGSEKDLEDGFIHLSTWRQMFGTMEIHFINQSPLFNSLEMNLNGSPLVIQKYFRTTMVPWCKSRVFTASK